MADSNAIGPYRLLEPLGQGGMGVVYRARHTASERAVALKTVKVPSTRWLESIRREIQALTRIRHPGVVRIVDHGVHEGRPWYAMDLLEGESLAHFAERVWSPYRRPSMSPLPPTERASHIGATQGRPYSQVAGAAMSLAEPVSDRYPRMETVPRAAAGELQTVLRIMRRICASLAYLHGEGFVDCDLKPENVLLVDGQPVIIDFGLTAQHPGGSGREALETQRAMSGTLPYMSPEQIRGEFLDARSDLYAVGCMLYELVVGHVPFAGAPFSIKNGHLSALPVAPSELVADVPPELERVILKLLEKDLDKRFGYADEVAALLADMSGDAHRLRDFPPSRSYLYRPRFVGRDDLVARLSVLRDRAIDGSGALVLLAGESGVGKTRVAMELTRVVPSSRMQIVMSEASSLSTERAGAVGSSPLHAVRPLLQAVADRCQEGGAEVTERLLGPRRSVLALYEPLLAQVPATGSLPPPMPLSAEASRQRLFKYLAETVLAFAQDRPLLWVIDDLSWADELSLTFLQSLTGEYLSNAPALIVCTYRSEEQTEAVAAIARLAHVTHVTLPRLGHEAVSSMIRDMLALRESKDGFDGFVSRQAEGNPFFVAEYLRTAVTERVLYRDGQHSWQMAGRQQEARPEYESLPLPVSLRELIDQRLRRLTPAGQQAGLAAAVLGREADAEVVGEVTGLPEDAKMAAVDELLRRQILQQAGPGRLRFVHDKLREVLYSRAPPDRVGAMHSIAADALERRLTDGAESRQHWAALGHHFAAARRLQPAAKYLKLAADHARATYANGEAVLLYEKAIKQVNEMLLSLSGEAGLWEDVLTETQEAMADLLALGRQRDKARAAYEEAALRVPEDDRTSRARLSRKIGKTWETQHQPEEALRLYGASLSILGDCRSDPDSGRPTDAVQEWIQVHIDQMWVYYYMNRLSQMSAMIDTLVPIVDEEGTPSQRAQFFQNRALLNFRRDRYFVAEETVRFAKTAVDACMQNGGSAELPMAKFVYGFALLHQHSLVDAEAALRSALALAERAGDAPVQARCLAYLTVAARMRGRLAEAGLLVEQSALVAPEAGTLEYVAVALANRAWLRLQQGDLDGAEASGRQALDIWRQLSALFPFHWLALIPLIEVALRREDIARCVELAEALLAPGQQYLVGASADAFARGVEDWRAQESAEARAAIARALDRLNGTGFR